MKHRSLALAGAALALALVFSGCNRSGSGAAASAGAISDGYKAGMAADQALALPYEKPVQIHIVLGYRESEDPRTPKDLTPQQSYAVTLFKEKLNIELIYDWIVNSDQYEAKFGAELAAGNLPDIMFLSPNQFGDIYSQGGLADLTEAWNRYNNDTLNMISNHDGQLLNSGKRDGKIYGLPMATYNGQQTSQTYYRMDYLKAAGITSEAQLPKTIAEFEALCAKLMTVDFDGDGKTGGPIIPAGKTVYGEGLADFSPVFNAYNASTGGYINEGGSLVYGGFRKEVVDALRKVNEWYTKGYIAKDFAAYGIYDAASPVVSDIVAGKFPIVFGSWWIPNWPLNQNKTGQPNAEWVVGPTLTINGEKPNTFVDRYPVNNFVTISRNFKNPEAILKLMNLDRIVTDGWNIPGWEDSASPQDITNKYSFVYTWVPWRTYSPNTLVANQQFFAKMEREGKTTAASIDLSAAPKNGEFYGVLNNYLTWHSGDHSGVIWGNYYSRVASNGGVARMYDLFTNSNVHYNELFATTPAMISYSGELSRLYDTGIIQMIMGEQPLTYFDTLKTQWLNQGGQKVLEEVNAWYASTK